jgi:hypothetical protein
MSDKQREIHEKLTEIDNIKKAVRQSYVAAPIGFFAGIAMLVMYISYPSLQAYTGMLLLFGIGFIILGIGGIIDVKWLFPRRLAKAEAEYESIKNRE